MKPELDRLADEAEAQAAKRQKVAAENVEADVAYGKMSRKNAAQAGKKTWLERNMPEDALESLRASPDTQAAKQARSRAQEIQNLVAGGKITPDAGVKLLQTEMRAYASRSDELAGDVMLKKRQDAERATRSRKRGKPPESSLATSEGSDRALKAEQQRAAQETTERQPLEYEKTLYTTDDRGKIIGARKLKPGARLRLEARRKAHRELPAKIRAETPEPRLTPDDYEPVVTKPEYDYQRRIREYDEFEAARKGLREAADTTRDPSLGRLITKSGERMSDQAAVRAQEKAARAAFDRRPNFNDAEFAFLQAKGEVDSSSLDKARDFIYRLRRDKKTLIQTDDGGFDYMDESGLIGGADMPEVDRKFLKSLKEFKREPRGPVPRAPTRGPTSVKVDREALKSRRRAQLAEAQPKPSGPISSGAMMDSYPSMSDREVAENARELRRVFRDDPDVLKEIDGIILGLRSSPSVPAKSPRVKKNLTKPLTVDQLSKGGKVELYVGSPKAFTEFRPSSSGQFGAGVYLSADQGAARGFSLKTGKAYMDEGSRPQTGNLMTVEVDIKNPIIATRSLTESQKKDWARAFKKHGRTKELDSLNSDATTSFDVYNSLLGIVGPGMRASAADAAKAKQIAQDAGYDSVVIASKSGTPPEVVVFNPENIKIKSTEKTRSKAEVVDKGPQVRGSESDEVW